jgi:isopenicillin N synthase-like dioxygenase
MKLLAQRLLSLISESLGLKPTYIQEVIGEPYQNISLNFYPPCPQPDLTLGLQSHSDLGAITLLLQDEVGGLQVRVDGDWIPVQPIPCALVVNLADQIEVGLGKSAC